MKHYSVKLLATFLAVIMLTVSGGTCALAQSEGYDLVFWVYADVVTTDVQSTAMNQIIDNFLAQDPDVKSITMVPKNDSELLTSLMAGVGLPDCFYASARDGYNYRQTIDLIDLSECYAQQEEGFVEGFYPDALDAVTVDGGIWATPFISYIPVIYRNLDILEAAGIDPAEGIPTWDRFIEQMDAVKEAGFDATHSWAAGGWFCTGSIMGSEGSNITVGVQDGKTTIKPEQAVRTFETLLRIQPYANNTQYGDNTALEAFKAGELAYLLEGPWSEPGIIDSGVRYDVELVPPYEVGGHTGGMQGWDWMYGVKSGDPEKDAAIARFITYLGSYESEKIWLTVVGRSVLRRDVMSDPENLLTEMAVDHAKGLEGGLMQMEFMHSNVFWPSPLGDIAPLVANGEMTPEEGAEAFVKAINSLYAEAEE